MKMTKWILAAAIAAAVAPALAEPGPRGLLDEMAPQMEAFGPTAMFTVPAGLEQATLRVRVFAPDESVVLSVETADHWVEFVPHAGMADGIYRYEMTVVTDGSDSRSSGVARDTGYLQLLNGRIHMEPRVIEEAGVPSQEELSANDEPGFLLRAVAGLLDFVIPEAQAQDLYAWSTAPSVFFDDTQDEDCTAGYDWFMKADGGANDGDTNNTFTLYGYGENPPGQGCNNSIATILKIYHDGRTGLGSAAKSIYVEADGDISLANDAAFLDRSHGQLELQGETQGGQSQLRLTDSASGNSARFTFDGTHGGLTNNGGSPVIKWHRNAPANSIVVDANGDVSFLNGGPGGGGSGSGPIETLELMNTGNGLSAFLTNGGTYFHLEGTSGQQDIMRMHLSAPANSVFLNSSGRLGFGTSSPSEAMHLRRTNGTAQLLVEEASGSPAARTLFKLKNRGNTKFELEETNSGTNWAFTNSGDDFRVSRQGSGAVEFRVDNAGNAFLAGNLTQNSDRAAKQNIVGVDAHEVLDRVAELPISQWEYIDTPGVPHIGPMAQDFYAAFELGDTDRGISTIDTAGVALVAIQALKAENDRLRSQNLSLEQRVHSLEQAEDRLESLEAMVLKLVGDQLEPVLVSQ